MATVNPQTFFRFAADHHELMVDLYKKKDGISEAELLQLIRRHSDVDSPSSSYMVDRLHELGFIDYAPHATAQYEMTRPFAELMASLLREYRLTSVEVIRGYFTAMDNYSDEIHQAVQQRSDDVLVRALSEVAEHVEAMRQDSRRNHDGVVGEVMRVKSHKDRMSTTKRYEIINRLWERYIVPLRDMIDTEKAMDESLDRMERVLEEAADEYRDDDALEPRIERSQARVRRLRREVSDDFRETIREISPLYEELRRENVLASGASQALERISRDGLGSLNLPEKMQICNWQRRNLLSDGAIEAYLYTLQGYEPTKPPPLREVEEQTKGEHIRLDRFDEAVAEALPLDDALAWLTESYPEVTLNTLLRLYGRLHSEHCGPVRFRPQKTDYEVGDAVLTAHPMGVEEDND